LEEHGEDEVRIESIISRIGHKPYKFETFLRTALSEFMKEEERLPRNVKELIKYARGRYYFVEIEPKKEEEMGTITTQTSKIRTDFAILNDKFPNEQEALKFRAFLKEQFEEYGKTFITELRVDALDFRKILKSHHTGARGVIITEDIDDEESLIDLVYWAKFCHEALQTHGKSLETIPLIFVIETHQSGELKKHRNYNVVKRVIETIVAPIALVKNKADAEETLEFLARIMYEDMIMAKTGRKLIIDPVDRFIHENSMEIPSLDDIMKKVEDLIDED
jgi:hypothetical protein